MYLFIRGAGRAAAAVTIMATQAASQGFPAPGCDSCPTTPAGPAPPVTMLMAPVPYERVSVSNDPSDPDILQDPPVGCTSSTENTHPDISRTGYVVAWATAAYDALEESDPDKLNPDCNVQVYARDRILGQTVLVSGEVASASGGMKYVGDKDSNFPAVSGDGRWVVFRSTSQNLPAGYDANGDPIPDGTAARDIFLHDLQTSTTVRVSQNVNTGEGGNLDSDAPDIDYNGRYIVFSSRATNLVSSIGGQNAHCYCPDWPTARARAVFLLDRGSLMPWNPGPGQLPPPSLQLISVGYEDRGTGPECKAADGRCDQPSISDSGCRVAFRSKATNLIPGETISNSFFQIYVWTRDEIRLITRHWDTGAAIDNADSTSPLMSGDGRYVGFLSDSDDLLEEDDNFVRDVFVYDLEADTVVRVNHFVDSMGGVAVSAQGGHRFPMPSPNGRFVGFATNDSNLTEPGQIANPNTFEAILHDRDADNDGSFYGSMVSVSEFSTLLAARGPAGDYANDWSGADIGFTADGKEVMFTSYASDLVTGDNNGPGQMGQDVFVREVWQ